MEMTRRRRGLRTMFSVLAVIAIGLVVNLLLSALGVGLVGPVFIGLLGTYVVAFLCGSFPSIMLSFLTTIICTLFGVNYIYFGLTAVLISFCISFYFTRTTDREPRYVPLMILVCTLLNGVLGSAIIWRLEGFNGTKGVSAFLSLFFINTFEMSEYLAQMLSLTLINLIINTVFILLAIAILRLLPVRLKRYFSEHLRLTESTQKDVRKSMLNKVLVVTVLAEVVLLISVFMVTILIYRDVAQKKYLNLCEGVTQTAIAAVDADSVERYLEEGRSSPGYEETERRLYDIKDSFPQIEFIYAYKIEEEGCRVVFDMNTDEVEASEVGDLIPFDKSFENMTAALLAGEEIDPIISNDTYGWLLTVYKPVKDSTGKVVCYMAADVDMADISDDENLFITKIITSFFSVSLVLIAVVFALAKTYLVSPINRLAKAAKKTSFESKRERKHSIERLEELDIRSGDELESLYTFTLQMVKDSASHIDEIREKNDYITKMQEAIIIDFAQMVEARDKCTGDHINNTSKYVKAIGDELRRSKIYPDLINKDYVKRLVRSAPLHDIGKIKISDNILNKPGKLTPEEFELMKTHTTAGKDILSATAGIDPKGGYLNDAIDMAYYHHERWDGTGYPTGIKGDKIPISARIMAVADVFDALVSKRSYKEPFTLDEALKIIVEESGTHFDPVVVDAFVKVAADVYNHKEEKQEKELDVVL